MDFINNSTEQKKTNPKENNNVDKEVEQYTDIEGVSTKKLNFGLWYVEHRKTFRASFAVFLIILSALAWAYTFYNFLYYYTQGLKQDNMITQSVINTAQINHYDIEQNSAQRLSVSNVEYFRTDIALYDLYARIKNSNEKFYATFEYCFINGEEKIECDKNFILPNETKYVMALTKEVLGNINNTDFVINDLRWSRINAHDYPDWNKFKDEHLDIGVQNVKFTPAKSSGLSENLNLNTLEFTVNNHTAYNYWGVKLNIILYQGSSVIGINQYTANEFLSQEERNISITWPGNLGQASDITVEPDLNILQDDIYMKF